MADAPQKRLRPGDRDLIRVALIDALYWQQHLADEELPGSNASGAAHRQMDAYRDLIVHLYGAKALRRDDFFLGEVPP